LFDSFLNIRFIPRSSFQPNDQQESVKQYNQLVGSNHSKSIAQNTDDETFLFFHPVNSPPKLTKRSNKSDANDSKPNSFTKIVHE